jgi:hypothetical protein
MDLREIAGMLNLIQYRNDDTLFLEDFLLREIPANSYNIVSLQRNF